MNDIIRSKTSRQCDNCGAWHEQYVAVKYEGRSHDILCVGCAAIVMSDMNQIARKFERGRNTAMEYEEAATNSGLTLNYCRGCGETILVRDDDEQLCKGCHDE